METGTWSHVRRLAVLSLLLSLLSADSDAGRVRCGQNHFQPANDQCTPCRQCGLGEVIHRPCSDTRDTVCLPLITTYGSLLIRCSGFLGVYLEGNSSALTHFKVARHKRKESKLTRLKREKLEKTTCKLAQISAKKVLKVHTYPHRECPTEGQYVWKNSHKNVTCRLCSQCPNGSDVVRSCGGRQDTACSFPAVPGTVQLFSFACRSTGTHVLVYGDLPHCVSQFRHDVEQGKLAERLCTALKANLPSSAADHVKKKKYQKRGPRVRSGRNGFRDSPTTVTIVNTTTIPVSTISLSTATSSTIFFRGDLALFSTSWEDSSTITTTRMMDPELEVEDDNDDGETSSGETSDAHHPRIVAIVIAAVSFIFAVFILGAILHVGHLLRRQAKRIKETTFNPDSESGYVSLNSSCKLSSRHNLHVRAVLLHPDRGRIDTENRSESLNAKPGEDVRCHFPLYLTTVAEFTTDDSQQDCLDVDTPQWARVCSAESGYLTAARSIPQWAGVCPMESGYLTAASGRPQEEANADVGSSADTETDCMERLTSFRPTVDPHIVFVTNVKGYDPQSTDYTAQSAKVLGPTTAAVGATTQEESGAGLASPVRSSLSSPASLGNLTDVSQPDSFRAPVPAARENFDDSDFSSGTEDVMEELLSSCMPTRHSLTSSSSRSTTVSMEIRLPLNNDVNMASLSAGWLHKAHNIPIHNVLFNYSASASTQTDDADEECPPPVFCSNWQGKKSVTQAGGSLQLSHSDVRLEIPAKAVPPAVYVNVVVATYTNLAHVRAVLDISNNHYFLSPVAELFAGPDFRFANPVHLYLPNALMTSVPEDHINVYHFHRADSGDLAINLLPSKSAYMEKHKATNAQTDSTRPPGNPTQDADFTGYFELLPTGQVRVTTTRFCGFTCTVCREHVPKQPQIHLLTTGSHLQIGADTWQVHIRLALWDRKITIADFQRDYLQGMSVVGEQSLSTVEDCEQSVIALVLNIYGPSAANWQHALRPNSRDHVLDVTKCFPLTELLHCNTQDSPRFEEWLVVNVPDRVPGPVFQCYIDATNEWLNQGAAGPECRPKKVTLFVSGVKKTRGDYDEWAALSQATSTLTVLSTKVTNEPARNVSATFQAPTPSQNNNVQVEVPATHPETARQLTAGPVERTSGTVLAAPQHHSFHSSQIDDHQLFGDGVLPPIGLRPAGGYVQANLTPPGEVLGQPSKTAAGDNACPMLAADPRPGVSDARVADPRPPQHTARGLDIRHQDLHTHHQKVYDSIHPAALMDSVPPRLWISESMKLTGIDYNVGHQGQQAAAGISRIPSFPGGLGEREASAGRGLESTQLKAIARKEPSTRDVQDGAGRQAGHGIAATSGGLGEREASAARGLESTQLKAIARKEPSTRDVPDGAGRQAGHGIAATSMPEKSRAAHNDNCRGGGAGADRTEMKRPVRQETRMYSEDSVAVHDQL